MLPCSSIVCKRRCFRFCSHFQIVFITSISLLQHPHWLYKWTSSLRKGLLPRQANKPWMAPQKKENIEGKKKRSLSSLHPEWSPVPCTWSSVSDGQHLASAQPLRSKASFRSFLCKTFGLASWALWAGSRRLRGLNGSTNVTLADFYSLLGARSY